MLWCTLTEAEILSFFQIRTAEDKLHYRRACNCRGNVMWQMAFLPPAFSMLSKFSCTHNSCVLVLGSCADIHCRCATVEDLLWNWTSNYCSIRARKPFNHQLPIQVARRRNSLLPSSWFARLVRGVGVLLGLDISALNTRGRGAFNGNIMISVQIYLGRVLQINGSKGWKDDGATQQEGEPVVKLPMCLK